MKTTIKYLFILCGMTVYAQLENIETTYSYDNLNRLVQVVFNDGSTHDYVYDDLGNRIQLNIETLSIDEETLKNRIIVYPNPADTVLNINMPDGLVADNASIKLYDINGRLIIDNTPTINNSTIKIDVQNLSNGVYLIHLKNNQQTFSQLFIKK